MKDLVIVGAGGFGREVYGWAAGMEAHQRWRIKGFLDDRSHLLDELDYPHEILDAPDRYEPQPGDRFACAVGDPEARRHYTELILERGGQLTNLIHWTALVSPRIRWGEGVIVGPYCSLACDLEIGDGACFNAHASVGHDARIGAYCQIQAFAFVGGKAHLGEGVTVQPHAVVMADAVVGNGAVVGPGSVALPKVPAHTTVFGVPASPLASRVPGRKA